MLRNYFTIILRSLNKNRGHALVNVFGLALGMTCSLVIFFIVYFELSYDQHHADAKRIYRVVTEYTKSEKVGYSSGITYALPDALRQDFADLEAITIVDGNLFPPVVSVTKSKGVVDRFKEGSAIFADPEYFKLFNYEWIEGNAAALQQEKSVVLTSRLARKYFGDEAATGNVINFNNEFDLTVTGVIADPPLNTDLSFSMIISSKLGKDKRGWTDWTATSSSINCFIKLNDGVSKEQFDEKLRGWHLKYFTGNAEQEGKERRYFLQPLTEMHFDTRFNNFAGRTVSSTTLIALSTIGGLLLLTACVNFINLNTVLIIKRSREAGVRKTLGSSNVQIIIQFMGETFLISLIALLVSAGLSELLLLNLTSVLGYRLSLVEMFNWVTVIFALFIPIIVTLLAGFYPAIRLSRYQPARTLKAGSITYQGEGVGLRRALIVFQLLISQGLVITTIIIGRQIDHFMKQPLGINSEAVVEFLLPDNKPELVHTLRDRLLALPEISSVSMSNTGATSNNSWGGDIEASVGNDVLKTYANIKFADDGYFSTYGINLIAGEGLVPSDTANRFVVNEKLARAMGFTDVADAIGTPVNVWGNRAVITGVVKDFNAIPLQFNLSPVIVLSGTTSYQQGAVRLNTRDLQEGVAKVKNAWESVYPNDVFEHSFLDEQIASFYDAERRNSSILSIFSSVAILIGSIGLFGLVSFVVQQRFKEIGIRKTFGATVTQIVAILSKEFVLLVAVAFVLATPIALYFMQKWLSNFAYRYEINGFEFLAGLALTLLISMSTVGVRAIRAAKANPIEALRSE